MKNFLKNHLKDGIIILWIGLFLQTVGQALSVYIYGSELGTTFFLNFDFSETHSQYIERFFATMVFIIWGLLFFTKKYWLLIYFAIFSILLSLGSFIQNAHFDAQFSFGAHLIRYCLPIGLIFLYQNKSQGPALGRLILRWGLAMTFIFHGVEALSFHPEFIDYLIEGGQLIFHTNMTESRAKNLLTLIGILDIAVGGLIGAKNIGIVVLYMLIWGGLTAVYRPIYHGLDGILPFLIRSSHYFVPLYFLLAGKVRILELKED